MPFSLPVFLDYILIISFLLINSKGGKENLTFSINIDQAKNDRLEQNIKVLTNGDNIFLCTVSFFL